MDNVHYVNGIKNAKGKTVIRPLNEAEKDFLNKFNAEYYGASFDKDDSKNLHKHKVDKQTINNVRKNIRDIKAKIKEYEKTEADVEVLRVLYKEAELLRETLLDMNPKLRCTDANNQRNSCIVNIGKATNELKFIAWDDVEQDILGELDVELLYILNEIKRIQ